MTRARAPGRVSKAMKARAIRKAESITRLASKKDRRRSSGVLSKVRYASTTLNAETNIIGKSLTVLMILLFGVVIWVD